MYHHPYIYTCQYEGIAIKKKITKKKFVKKIHSENFKNYFILYFSKYFISLRQFLIKKKYKWKIY